MKYKLDTHMKFEVLWWLLSEIVVHFLPLLTSFFYEDNKFYNNKGRIFSPDKILAIALSWFWGNLQSTFNNMSSCMELVSKFIST